VPEAFRQTLQEREDAFFRELYQNPNLQRGHPLSHMVVGAAKIRAHQQQMSEFQQNLGAAMMGPGGGHGGGQAPAPPPRPQQQQQQQQRSPGSPSSPKTAERIAASPYARMQILNNVPGGPGGGGQSGSPPKGEGRKKKKKTQKQKEREAMQRGTGPGGLDDFSSGLERGGPTMVESSQLGHVTEEDMSASASAHRDFLLQTLRNVRDQLSNPSPLIIAGMDEEDVGGMGGVGDGGSSYLSTGGSMEGVQSITLPQVHETASAFEEQGSRTDIRFLFDLIDPGHQNELLKMEVLRSISSVQRVRDLVENAASLAGLLEPASWADDFMSLKTNNEGTVSMGELEQFAMQMA